MAKAKTDPNDELAQKLDTYIEDQLRSLADEDYLEVLANLADRIDSALSIIRSPRHPLQIALDRGERGGGGGGGRG